MPHPIRTFVTTLAATAAITVLGAASARADVEPSPSTIDAGTNVSVSFALRDNCVSGTKGVAMQISTTLATAVTSVGPKDWTVTPVKSASATELDWTPPNPVPGSQPVVLTVNFVSSPQLVTNDRHAVPIVQYCVDGEQVKFVALPGDTATDTKPAPLLTVGKGVQNTAGVLSTPDDQGGFGTRQLMYLALGASIALGVCWFLVRSLLQG